MRSWLITFFLVLSFSSCNPSLFGIPRETWEKAKREGDFAFLSGVDFGPGSLPDLRSLGKGPAHALGLILADMGREQDALRFWQESLVREAYPFDLWSYEQLASRLVASGDHEQVESAAREYLRKDPENLRVRRDLLEALYWQKKDVEVLLRLSALDASPLREGQRRELELFQAVSAARAGHPDAPALWSRFLRHQPASSLHYRAYTFFEEDPSRYSLIPPADRLLVAFKAMTGEGKTGEALDAFRKLRTEPGIWESRVLVQDLEKLFLQGRKAQEGADILASLKPEGFHPELWAWNLSQGKLTAAAGKKDQAAALMRTAWEQAPAEKEKERVALALLGLYRTSSPERFTSLLEELGTPGVLAALGTRVLEDFRAERLRLRQWGLLHRVWRVIAFQGAPAMKASWAFVMIRLGDSGLLPLEYRIADPGVMAEKIREWDPLGYPSLAVSALLNLPWNLPSGPTDPAPVPESPTGEAYGELADFGLAMEAYRKFWTSGDGTPSLAALRKLAAALGARGKYLESQRVMIRAAARFPGLEAQDWKLRYPLAFDLPIREEARGAGVEPELFRALVREESFYDPEISSPVGARGLSQLMPATAKAMMARMGIPPESSLADPRTNLKIGARYLADRIRDFSSPAKALMAYNGGQGRVRTWNREFGHLPEDLYVEACPLEETRNYVKKIFVTAALYSRLYQNGRDALGLIYPGLDR